MFYRTEPYQKAKSRSDALSVALTMGTTSFVLQRYRRRRKQSFACELSAVIPREDLTMSLLFQLCTAAEHACRRR
jgi:hypothetical protein